MVKFKNTFFIALAILACSALVSARIAVAAEKSSVEKPLSWLNLIWQFGLYRSPPAPAARDDVTHALSGRAFDMVIQVRPSGENNKICDGTPYYGYSPKDHKLRVVYATADAADGWDASHAMFSVDCSVTKTREVRGNAFGAQALVDVRHETNDALKAMNITASIGHERIWEAEMDEAAATKLIMSLMFHVKGTIETNASDLIDCKVKSFDATWDNRHEIHTSSCIAHATITDMELVQEETKKVLAKFEP